MKKIDPAEIEIEKFCEAHGFVHRRAYRGLARGFREYWTYYKVNEKGDTVFCIEHYPSGCYPTKVESYIGKFYGWIQSVEHFQDVLKVMKIKEEDLKQS
ncbi:MAG: hypothetical protein Q4B58_06965 [Bacteroidales bacterium]|nr:hypothetical protein [Bacteroidales bacterium]